MIPKITDPNNQSALSALPSPSAALCALPAILSYLHRLTLCSHPPRTVVAFVWSAAAAPLRTNMCS